MDEGEGLSMKREPAQWVGLRTVFLVSCNRMSYILRVDADLVPAACFEVEFDHGVWFSFDCQFLHFPAMA